MRTAIRLALAVVPLAATRTFAIGFEEAALSSRVSFSALSGLAAFRFKPAPAPAPAAKAAALPDLAALFEKGTAPTQKDVEGWRSGRRFTKDGPAAALLVGTDIYDNPDDGPISGKTFKVFVFGADKPGIGPADLYDNPGSVLQDATTQYIRENAKKWSAAEFTAKAALTRKESAPPIEIRQNDSYLVARYADGTYGYFFKKVRK